MPQCRLAPGREIDTSPGYRKHHPGALELTQPLYDQSTLVILTAGVGGSLLSIGSAAGVAVMGQARGIYTFFAHLKWTWAIALGYAASIWVHFLINASLFTSH